MIDSTALWNRRDLLTSLAALSVISYVKPLYGLDATAGIKLKLGFDNFSIRAFGWKAPRLIQYAAAQKVDTLLLSDLDVYESLDKDYLEKIQA